MRISHIEQHIVQQTSYMDIIANSLNRLMSVGAANVTSHRIETRRNALKETWTKFSLNHDVILIAVQKLEAEGKQKILDHAYFKNNLFQTAHEGYLEALESMSIQLERIQQDKEKSPSVQSGSQISTLPGMFNYGPRLPHLNLPTFDGTPSEWLPFKDLFQSMVISNVNVTSVWKLHYLKQSLKGTASQLLKNTALTSDNFQKAWDSLTDFYENKRLLVNSALQSLMSLKRMTKESAAEMEVLYTTVTQIYRALETLGRPVETWDDIFVFITVQRLDSESVKFWEQHLGSSKEPPTWRQFTEFLMTRLLTIQAVEKSRKPLNQSSASKVKSYHTSANEPEVHKNVYKCSICSESHYTSNCSKYSSQTTKQRLQLIKQHKLCYNCLGHHKIAACRSTKRCTKCGKKHHSSIHTSNPSQQAENSTQQSTSETILAGTNWSSSHPSKSTYPVLLATIQAVACSSTDEKIQVKVLVDPGSQVSLISENLVQNLKLPRQKSSLSLIGIGAIQAGKTRGVVSLKLIPYFPSSTELSIKAYILRKLTSNMSSFNKNAFKLSHLQNIQLADPYFHSANSIDIIIGADYYGQILQDGVRRGPKNTPTAQSTMFGWILFGPSQDLYLEPNIHSFHVSVDEELNDTLQRFWKMEEVPSSSKSKLTKEEQECEDYFKSTHFRDSEGRYVVRLPFRKSTTLLGDSKAKALRMLSRLLKRFQTDSILQQAYTTFLSDYEALNHMLPVDESNEDKHSYYLPHHGVLRESSVSTKLRVVFNASSLTSTGVSLNDILHTGEKLQTELFDVLIWFRIFLYVFSADIEKMFRQVKVHPDDWHFQRILWNVNNETVCFQLTTVTYGMACAPFLALRALKQLIEDEGSKFPLAVPAIKKGRYVDDVFGGANTIMEAQNIVRQLDELCLAGGFPLKKWTSNNSAVLQNISTDNQLFPSSVPIDEAATVNALGMSWKPTADKFSFTWSVSMPEQLTKRIALSIVARLFDPLGLITPVTISAKIYMQELWSLKLDWDDPLPEQVSSQWNKFLILLQDLKMLSFPRWMGMTEGSTTEIHGFCDASQRAMAAVIYIRTTDNNNKVQTILLCSKTKVAPIKRMTIARLELSAAILATRLVRQVLPILNLNNSQVHLWTDSAVSFTWINNHPSKWKDFVHNRVCYIQESLPTAKWHFVPGKENPADLATRGVSPVQLSEQSIWWNGPDWLCQPSQMWPAKFILPEPHDNLEARPAVSFLTTSSSMPPIWNLLLRYSKLYKLLKITAICKRFILRLKQQAGSITKVAISTDELKESKLFWIKGIQHQYFLKDIRILSKGEALPKTNHLVKLAPFVDSNNLLRLGGRLQASQLSYNAKHPYILPRDSPFTQLVIDDAHQRTLHGGVQETLAYIKHEFWILGGRTPIKSFIWKCVTCCRYRKKRSEQLMGQLPSTRVTPSRAFLHSGIDYAGPFSIKSWKGRSSKTYKAYLVLFVCEATSAIHLEIVTDYTAEAFIAAYKRFTARRGICATLRSDCGTNLKGADTQLKQLFSSASREVGIISSLLAKDGTQWNFNPPAAPHFGGKWEAGVKSVKIHLRKIVGDHLLTYEELSTVFIQIEAVLNSRPLSALTEDPDDLEVLTPGHFLIGGPLTVIPEPSLDHLKLSRLSRWQLLKQMLDRFWRKWSKEHLQRYQTRYKWTQPHSSIKKGSPVLVIDERYPPAKWPLGRIVEVHPGKDGHIRVVTVKTQCSTLKRPITKISLLPIETNVL